MYKEELDELNQQNEVEVQRLKDQIKQLTEELSQVHRQPMDEVQVATLQAELQAAIEEKIKLKGELEKPKVHRTTSTIPIEVQTQIFEVCPVELDSFHCSEGEVTEENVGGQTIRVFARVRKPLEDDRGKESFLHCSPTSVEVKTKDLSCRKAGKFVTKQFLFERVFDTEETNEEVFAACQSTIEAVHAGGSVCLVAYGQTGSGKTYTMRGLIEQSLGTITRVETEQRLEISMQCIEIYNDSVRNLFNQDSESHSNKFTEFLNKSTIQLIDYSTEAIWELIAQANDSRVTKFTDANERSSRSHLLVTFLVRRGEVTGKLMFVDLAGSERLSASKVKGDILRETLCINKSLTSLQDVIAALEAKAAHVPYRNSVLTTLLQPVLSSSTSKVLMLFMVSPTEDSLSETICTLSLGVRLKSVELGSNIRLSLKNRNLSLRASRAHLPPAGKRARRKVHSHPQQRKAGAGHQQLPAGDAGKRQQNRPTRHSLEGLGERQLRQFRPTQERGRGLQAAIPQYQSQMQTAAGQNRVRPQALALQEAGKSAHSHY